MKKQIMIVIGIIVVIAVVLVVVFSLSRGNDSATNSETKAPTGAEVLSEEEKFAQFQAELSCELASSSSAEDVFIRMEKLAPLMEKYSYTNKDYQELKTKYEDQDSFKQLVLSKMKEQCPEVVEQMS